MGGMTTRTKRMKRLAELTEKHERRSRQELVRASNEQEAAETALRSVFLQCREVVEQPDAFSVRFGRGLIEAGWLAEQQRRVERDAAAIAVESRRSAWQAQRTRLDALGRLVDRLAEDEEAAAAREAELELEDLINARTATSAEGAVA
jgi:flagellar biosynthesis chaperone FliJ